MRKVLASLALVALPCGALACKCPDYSPHELISQFQRIALVEVTELGSEFDGKSPIPDRPGRNRLVRIRTTETFLGSWAVQESVEESVLIGGLESNCSLHLRMGDRFILLLNENESPIEGCNVRAAEPALIEALRAERKGA